MGLILIVNSQAKPWLDVMLIPFPRLGKNPPHGRNFAPEGRWKHE
jgi:hypothetical protein